MTPPLDLLKPTPTGKPETNALRLAALELEVERLQGIEETVEFMREQFKVMQSLLIMLAHERISTSSACNSIPSRQDKEGQAGNPSNSSVS